LSCIVKELTLLIAFRNCLSAVLISSGQNFFDEEILPKLNSLLLIVYAPKKLLQPENPVIFFDLSSNVMVSLLDMELLIWQERT